MGSENSRYRAETAIGPYPIGCYGIDQPLISGSGVRNPDGAPTMTSIVADLCSTARPESGLSDTRATQLASKWFPAVPEVGKIDGP